MDRPLRLFAPYNLRILQLLSRQPRTKLPRIPRLHEHCPRPRELAHQALPCHGVGNNAPRGDALEHVLAVPGDEVVIVDVVFFVFGELWER